MISLHSNRFQIERKEQITGDRNYRSSRAELFCCKTTIGYSLAV